ncbi:MAG: SpoIIE family protein phosphatase, partial [Lachnospiraceae bacterium]|nr:SpoIIE family protein phosphatase [Lachnospiraceae bacterium]
LAGLFKTMAELFSEPRQVKRPDAQISRIVKVAADEVCTECIWHKKCWEEEFLDTYNAFEKVTENILLGKQQDGVTKMCVNESGVIGAVKRATDEARRENTTFMAKSEGNALLGKQFKGLATLLYGMNGDIKTDVKFESDIERNIRDELQLKDMAIFDVCVMRVAGAYRCEIVTDTGTMGSRNLISKAVSKFCGRPMVLTDCSCISTSDRYTLKYIAQKPLKVTAFMAQSAKERVCGDSYKIGFISDSKYMLCISDGMGSGKAAKDESDSCVNLLYSFFKAGFEDSVIFATINKLLMLKSDTEIFTTADICVVDVIRSKACFTKIGAVPSVLIKRDTSYAIRGDSLPLGILDEINEKSFDIDIEDGDILIMFTDGVYDALTQGEKEIEKVVMEIVGNSKDIREITSDILDKCNVQNNGEKKDDMTILISMFKK